MTSGDRVPIILDVDTGVDDALALALAVRSPRAELVAVTTVAGNVDVTRATANSLAVLDWLGATAMPVHRGASHPLARPHKDAVFVHGTNGIGNADLGVSDRSAGPDRGPAAMIRLATARPGELALVCVGPLTNLAIALNVEPRLTELVREVVIMGGAYDVRGNITQHAEFNIHVDPEAAAQVFAAPFARITVVGLDVSHQTALPHAVWEAAAAIGNSAAELVVRICHRAFVERELTGVYLHDPLALAVALDPTLVTCEESTVTVDLANDTLGRTRISVPGPVRIAKTVDSARFLQGFYDALGLSAVDVDQASLRRG
jgi:inosine-uridine nucleoside N-ribohydrolase